LNLAVETFKNFLKEDVPPTSPEYYRARNFMRDAEKFHQETFKEAKRLLGPLPAYSSSDTEKWRTEYLTQHKILTESRELEAMRMELLKDEYLKQRMSKGDIERLLLKNFARQGAGKRKLANVKVRLLLDRLNELLEEARELKKRVMVKFQTGS
jgi:hypothetical protein